MLDDILRLSLYLFWELSLFAFACVVAVYALKSRRDESQDYEAEFVSSALVIKLLLGAVIPQTAVLLGGVTLWMLIGISMLSALSALGLWYRLAGQTAFRRDRFFSENWNLTAVFVCIAVVSVAPAMGNSVMPVMEVDSIRHSGPMLGFIDGTAHPFEFFNNYVALWESSYLPGLVMSDSVYYLALTSVQVPILFSLTSYLLSRELGLKPIVAGLLALAAILCGHFWGSFSTGTGTLKNDAASAAGILLMVLATIRFIKSGQITPSIAILLLGGLILGSMKFAGPIIAVGIFLLLVVFFFKRIQRVDARSLMFFAGVIVLFFMANGFYYVRNWYEFGNPVAPFILRLGPILFPGHPAYDPVGTRIIDYLQDPKMWRLFFGIDSFWAFRTAFLIPVWFIVLVAAPVCLLFRQRISGRAAETGGLCIEPKIIWFVWLVTLMMWLLFMQTIWTAGVHWDPYFYIISHNSFRFAIAHYQLLLILTTLILFSMGRIPRIVGYSLLLIEILGRLSYLYEWFLWHVSRTFPWWETHLLALILTVPVIAMVVFARVRPLFGVVLFLVLIALFSPWLYERNRAQAGWQLFAMDDVEKGTAPCSSSALIWPENEESSSVAGILPYAFAAVGSDLKCRYLGQTSPGELERRLNEAQSSAPDFVVVTKIFGTNITDDDIIKMNGRLDDIGYTLLLKHPYSAVYGRQSRRAATP